MGVLSAISVGFALVLSSSAGADDAVADAPCASPSTTSELVRMLGTAEAYFSSLNAEGFTRAVEEASGLIVCLQEELPLTIAAEFHRYQAIKAFVEKESTACMLSFAAARTIEPDYTFPDYLVPADNPILDNYTAVDPSIGKHETLPDPRGGYLQFDGSKSIERPTDFPTVVQLFNRKGVVLKTAYLQPASEMFEYQKARPKIANLPLMLVSGAALISSGALYAVANKNRSEYDCVGVDCETILTPKQLNQKRKKVNRYAVTSGVVGAVGLGLGATAFIVVRL